MNNFKKRLEEIKKQRHETEQLLLNSHIEKLEEFNIEKRMLDNHDFAKKNLFVRKIFGSINSTLIVSSVGSIAFGAACFAGLPVSLPVALGGVLAAGVGSTTLMFGGSNLFKSASHIFKSTEEHNRELIEQELTLLRNTIQATTVNTDITTKDYFLSVKKIITEHYRGLTENKPFKPLSTENVFNQINQLKTINESVSSNEEVKTNMRLK